MAIFIFYKPLIRNKLILSQEPRNVPKKKNLLLNILLQWSRKFMNLVFYMFFFQRKLALRNFFIYGFSALKF